MSYEKALRNNRERLMLRYGALAIAVLLLNACAQNDEPTFTSLWDDKFNGCGLNCHSASAADGTENGPDLSTKSGFYNNLVNKSTNDYPGWFARTGNCDGFPFIKPGDAANSVLSSALIQSYSDSFSASHSGCSTTYNIHVVAQSHITSSDLQDRLISWINDGAKNN